MIDRLIAMGAVIAAGCGMAFGGVTKVKQSPVIDGVLDEAVWAKTEWTTGFQAKISNPDKTIENQTAFAVLTDGANLYFGFRCAETDIEGLKKEPLGSLWTRNQLNIFLAPSGNGFDYYQFAFNPVHGLTAALAKSEGGNIQLEPFYAPDWEVKTAFGEKEWTAEVRVSIGAFYHTRAENWKTEWLVNVGRVRIVGDRVEKSSWSPVQDSFPEIDKFRPFKGFPPRHWKDDVALTDVQFVPSGVENGRIKGVISANLHLKARGSFTLTTDAGTNALDRSQLAGDRLWRLPVSFEKSGTHEIGLRLVRREEGGVDWPHVYSRRAKVRVEYEPIAVSFTKPGYRANFYPGQDSSAVEGEVKTAMSGEIRLSIEGDGIERRELTLAEAGRFRFETPGFREGGEARLTVAAGGERREFKVRRLAATGRRMCWIENGGLVVDGKPIVSRRIAHPGYNGGAWLDSIFKTNDMHDTTAYVGEMSIEFGRLVPGSEAREGTRDQKPSKEVFDAVAKRLEEARGKDFAFWYLCDEPECRNISPVYLKHLYDFIAERDPYHVIRSGTRAPKTYLECCDWFETHPYINPQNLPDGRRVYGRPLNKVGDFVSEIADLKRPDKCIGFYTTAFAYTYKNPNSDYPTFDEYVTHAWAGMIRGARTIIPYAYHDIGDRASILEGTRFVFRQIEVLSPFIIADRRTVVSRKPEAEIVKYECGGDTLTVKVDYKALKVDLDVTGAYAAKLPSYEEARALVDRLEYERTHTGSKLLGKWQQLGLDGSGQPIRGKKKLPSRYKLTDGVRNVYAGKLKATKANWLEVDLGEAKTTVVRAAVWGDMKMAKFSVKKGGEWQQPVEGTRNGKWEWSFSLPEPVEAEAIRFEFNRGAVELYEVEVF